MTTKKTSANNGHPKRGDVNAFRFEGLGHVVCGLIIPGTDHLAQEQWTFMVLVDSYAAAQCNFDNVRAAQRCAWEFQYGHLRNLIDSWAEEARNR